MTLHGGAQSSRLTRPCFIRGDPDGIAAVKAFATPDPGGA